MHNLKWIYSFAKKASNVEIRLETMAVYVALKGQDILIQKTVWIYVKSMILKYDYQKNSSFGYL